MADEPTIFRTEALEARAQAQGHSEGDIVRFGPRWARWAFWVLIGLVAVALIAGSRIRIGRYATGPSTIGPGGSVVVLLPEASAADVTVGDRVDLGAVDTEVAAVEAVAMEPAEVRERFGIDVGLPSVAVVTSVGAGEASIGTGRVRVGTDPVLVALIPGLGTFFGGTDG
jgi:hypothetical protein